MQPDLRLLREEIDSAAGTASAGTFVSNEQLDFYRRWQQECLWQARQDRQDRKAYATRIFWLVCLWLSVIVALVVLQGFLGQSGWFSLSDSVLIAVATSTTASVTALLVVVVRFLFCNPDPAGHNGSPPRNKDR